MDDSELEEMATPSGSSLGDAVSGRGQSMSGEGDELFYIPERRPSLDLGPSPMDTSHWQYVDQAASPALGYRSMTSEDDSVHMSDEDGSPTRVQLSGADSYSSCYSLDSDDCEKMIPKLKCKDDTVSELPVKPELFQDPNEPRHPSLTVAFTFKAISKTLGKLSEADLRYFKMLLWKRYSHSFNTHPQGLDMVDLVDRLLECFNLEFSLQITKTLLQDIEQTKMIDYLETLCIKNEVRHDLCENLKKKFGEVREDADPQGERRPFDDVFTDLYISSTCDNGPNIEHEDEYFQKRFTDPDQAARVIAYINSSKTLRIMCHLPLFCSLVADEFQPIFRNQATRAEPPRNITYMYTKLLLALIRPHRAFRAPHRSLNKERDFLMTVGKMAFDMLERGKFKISKYDWEETGVNDEEVVINSGLCTQYMRSPHVLCHEKVISFIHPTMQEYLAALYVFLYFTNQGKNIFEQQLKDRFKGIFKGHTAIELYKSAVDHSLRHDDGKYDIFLRFLLGMGLKTNLGLLEPFCTATVKWPTLVEDATALIEKRIRENQYPGRNGNLKLCLEELKS
ncbi:hypothetical protein VZT92_006151 [Zoarces viviparus]|uniref:Uncharacterized protein n=1 Tax=Zoarces viviparus TaxID=48416 RepID=A0AAW1FNL8_ZOAVI